MSNQEQSTRYNHYIRKICTIPLCDYPASECYGTCFQPDETRLDIIGQNGNDGLHYKKALENENK